MKKDIRKIQKKLEKERAVLNSFFETDSIDISSTEIYNQSTKLDDIISEYINTQAELYEERSSIMDKYNEILNQPYRAEITGEIRKEVRLDNPNVGIKELEHFSNNVYVYCCLLAHNIPEQEIVNQLLFLNNKYFEQIQTEEPATPEGASKITNKLEYLTNLKNKYLKIIKERI